MPEAAPPRAVPHWESLLARREPSELYQLREALDELSLNPAWREIVYLVTGAREFLLDELKKGPTRTAEGYARLVGYVTGLDELGQVAVAIRNVTDEVEAKERARAVREEAPLERGRT